MNCNICYNVGGIKVIKVIGVIGVIGVIEVTRSTDHHLGMGLFYGAFFAGF